MIIAANSKHLPLKDESVQMVCTSPPYWGLRSYIGSGEIRKVHELGLEKSPEEYVANMVAVFREVRRVLKKDGVLWLNLGDSYWGSGKYFGSGGKGESSGKQRTNKGSYIDEAIRPPALEAHDILKPKDLVGIPWKCAFALQADGWTLRSDVIWSKPNPMPESVTDRPTKSHEYLFLFSKAEWRGAERGQFCHISDDDARWLALFIDTEGNICVKRVIREESGRTQYGVQVTFANTSRCLLDKGQRIVGVGSIHERSGKNAPMFYWQITGQQARDFLHRIYPFLIVKQRQAALGIHVCDVLSRNGKKRPGGYRDPDHTIFLESAWARMKSLNHFGNPDLSDVPSPLYGRWDSAKYYYNAEAIAERATTGFDCEPGTNRDRYDDSQMGSCPSGGVRPRMLKQDQTGNPTYTGFNARYKDSPVFVRNKRTVWHIATQSYSGSHFATFPEEIPRLCILAGSRPGDVILDPFGGSGTTAKVALELGRKPVHIDLGYHDLAKKRCTTTPAMAGLM